MLLAADGFENQQIAAQMGIWPEKVARWLNRYVKGGIAALEKQARGRAANASSPRP